LWTPGLEFFSGGYRDSEPSFRAMVKRLRALHWGVDHAPYRNVVRKYEKLTKWHRAGTVRGSTVHRAPTYGVAPSNSHVSHDVPAPTGRAGRGAA
jgi:hypothetical protein